MKERVESDLRHMVMKECLTRLEGMLEADILAMETETRLMRWMAMIVAAGVCVTTAIVTLVCLGGLASVEGKKPITTHR